MNDSDISTVEEFQGAEAELAQQLFDLRQEPGSALQQRVRTIPERKSGGIRFIPRLAWGLAALLVVGLLFISPPATATLGQVEQWIGHVQLTIQDTYQSTRASTLVESVQMSLAEARTAVPYPFGIPTYLPAELEQAVVVSVIQLDLPIVKLYWPGQSGGSVQLTAHPFSSVNLTSQTLVGANSHEAVQVNGQPAAVVYGAWNATSQTWSHQTEITTLIWADNGIQYRLLAASTGLDEAELVKMAESVE
jgi:hypothetical protein